MQNLTEGRFDGFSWNMEEIWLEIEKKSNSIFLLQWLP